MLLLFTCVLSKNSTTQALLYEISFSVPSPIFYIEPGIIEYDTH